MKGIICFERSQRVASEFIRLGHDFYSCDLQDTIGGFPDRHLKMDVYEALNLYKWDYVGLHPVCTKMTNSSNRHYAPGKPLYQERLDSIHYTLSLFDYCINNFNHVYMENPVGALNSCPSLPRPQIVQPFYFGDPFRKTTCFWFHNLPILSIDKSKFVSPGEIKNGFPVWMNNNDKNHRSLTFPGIARAIAFSHSNILNNVL